MAHIKKLVKLKKGAVSKPIHALLQRVKFHSAGELSDPEVGKLREYAKDYSFGGFHFFVTTSSEAKNVVKVFGKHSTMESMDFKLWNLIVAPGAWRKKAGVGAVLVRLYDGVVAIGCGTSAASAKAYARTALQAVRKPRETEKSAKGGYVYIPKKFRSASKSSKGGFIKGRKVRKNPRR